jgi:hypothetical protein
MRGEIKHEDSMSFKSDIKSFHILIILAEIVMLFESKLIAFLSFYLRKILVVVFELAIGSGDRLPNHGLI